MGTEKEGDILASMGSGSVGDIVLSAIMGYIVGCTGSVGDVHIVVAVVVVVVVWCSYSRGSGCCWCRSWLRRWMWALF